MHNRWTDLNVCHKFSSINTNLKQTGERKSEKKKHCKKEEQISLIDCQLVHVKKGCCFPHMLIARKREMNPERKASEAGCFDFSMKTKFINPHTHQTTFRIMYLIWISMECWITARNYFPPYDIGLNLPEKNFDEIALASHVMLQIWNTKIISLSECVYVVRSFFLCFFAT